MRQEFLKSRIDIFSRIIIAELLSEYRSQSILFCLYQFTEAFEEASSLLGNIDIVVNNAGVLDERRWEKEIAVNIVSIIDNSLFIYQ